MHGLSLNLPVLKLRTRNKSILRDDPNSLAPEVEQALRI
jgi:hypothetical protein